MIIFFDTETTGVPSKKVPFNHPSQPHIVQIAALQHDEKRQVIGQLNFIIKPEGWTIPAEAAKVHGITQDIAEKYGIPLILAMASFNNMLKTAKLAVAHNLAFDNNICGIAYNRLNKPNQLKEMDKYCTMQSSIDVCKLPGRYGKPKWPKLQEAYVHFFNREFEGAHNAMNDVEACAEVYYKLQEHAAA